MPRELLKTEGNHQTHPQADHQADRQVLEKLVDELMKDHPNKSILKKLSLKLGIPYSGDSVTHINTVLNTMNSVHLRPRRNGELES